MTDQFVEQLEANKIAINERDEFFIYALWQDDCIVYIGQTTSLDVRIKAHKKDKKFNKYSFLKCKDQREMDHIETLLIAELGPFYNKAQGNCLISLKRMREMIRGISKDYKYSQKFYINNLKKIIEDMGIEIINRKGILYVHETKAESILNHAISISAN